MLGEGQVDLTQVLGDLRVSPGSRRRAWSEAVLLDQDNRKVKATEVTTLQFQLLLT